LVIFNKKKALLLKKYLKKSLHVFIWIMGSLFLLFIVTLVAIQIPFIQNYAKEKAVTYLEGKIKTKVRVDNLSIEFPKKVILKGVYFEDQKKDTLFAGEKLAADISLFELISNKVEINSLELVGISANLNRDSKAVFNFDYILQAFASPEKQKSDSPPMEFSVGEIRLDRIQFKYTDAVTKNDVYANLKHFESKIKTFDLNEMNFEIPKAKINGLKFKLKQRFVRISNATKIAAVKNESESILKLKLGEIDLAKIQLQWLLNSDIRNEPTADNFIIDVGLLSKDISTENHPLIELSQQEIEQSKLQVQLEKSKLLPDLSLSYYNQSFRDIDPHRYNVVAIGIGIPIFASGQKANIKAEQQKIAFYENEQQVKKAQLETEYRSALNAYQTQKSIVENFQNKQLPQAEQIFKTAKEQFANGEINYLDWVLLNNQAAQIQTNYYQAVAQLNQTAITILYLISK